VRNVNIDQTETGWLEKFMSVIRNSFGLIGNDQPAVANVLMWIPSLGSAFFLLDF
jgi:hypothetical protein